LARVLWTLKIKLVIRISLYILLFIYGIDLLTTQNAECDSILNTARFHLKKSQPDVVIPLLINLLDSCNSDETIINANINLAEAYRQKKEFSKGIDLIYFTLKRYNLSDTDKAFAYNRLAALYDEHENRQLHGKDSAIHYSELCIKLAEKLGDENLLATSQNEIAYAYKIKHDLKKSVEFGQKAYDNFIEIGLDEYAINTAINLSGAYIDLHQYEKALEVNKQAFLLSSEEENRNLYMRLYLNKAHVYQMMEDYKNAFEAMGKARSMQKAFYEDRMKMQINEMSAKYDLQLKEFQIKEVETNRKISDQKSKYLSIIFVITVITFLIVLLTIQLKRKNKIHKAKLIEHENLQLKLSLETKDKELHYKNRELSEAISTTVSMNETLRSIKSHLNSEINGEAIKVINGNIYKNLNWEKFRISFNEIYPTFFNCLNEKYPTLTKNDKRLCAFLLMDMKTSEIANLMNISKDSVSKSRNRLRKKLGLKNGSDITSYLKNCLLQLS